MRSTSVLVGVALLSAACGSSERSSDTAQSAAAAATTTTPATTTPVAVEAIPEEIALALAEPGTFGVGTRDLVLIDATRGDREVRFTIRYPAQTTYDAAETDAAPDLAASPYPVVVASEGMAATLGPHLASHGFVVVGAWGQQPWPYHPHASMVEFPLDLLMGLDGLESLPDDDLLAEIADTGRVGVIDYSFGAWSSLMLAGARVNPNQLEQTCSNRPDNWTDQWFSYVCSTPEGMVEMTEAAATAGIETSGGLWAAMTDQRVLAAMPMAPEGFDLTGPDGLAPIDVPVLLVAAGNDVANDYEAAARPLYEHISAESVSMLTFVGADHFMLFEPDIQHQFKRFALAFFGRHLAGIDDYDDVLTEDFVELQAPYLEPRDAYETLMWEQ